MSKCRLLLLLIFVGFSFAGTISLKNKKQIHTNGAYIVEGNFVVYKNNKGESFKLPLNIVDLEQSRPADEEPAGESKNKNAQNEGQNRKKTMARLTDYVEENTSDMDVERRKTSFDNSDAALAKYERYAAKADGYGEQLTTAIVYTLIFDRNTEGLSQWLRTKPNLDDVTFIDAKLETPLIYAINMQNLEAVEMLLKAGADPNHIGISEAPVFIAITPIHSARPEFVELLLQHHANPNILSREGMTPILASVLGNNLPLFKTFVKYGTDLTVLHPKFGSLLEQTLCAKEPGFVEILLKKLDAKPAVETVKGISLSDYSIVNGYSAALPVILDYYERKKFEYNPVQMITLATSQKNSKILEFLLNRFPIVPKKLDSLVIQAVESDNGEGLLELLKRSANANAVDNVGDTALIHAARKGSYTMVKMLMDYGAVPTAKSAKGYTAFGEVSGPDREKIRSYMRKP